MNYNLTRLNELATGDQDFINSIISVFIEETPDDLNNLESAIKGKDFELIYQFAHKLKPNVDLLGMDMVTDSVLKIEKEARGDKSIDFIKDLFPVVDTKIKTTIQELKKDFGL